MDALVGTKLCRRCGVSQNLSEFHRRGERGRQAKCKSCAQAMAREPSVKASRKRRLSTALGKAKHAECAMRYRSRNYDKARARELLNKAIARGDIHRPDACGRCGVSAIFASDGRTLIEGHHRDYSKPFDVVWLCVSCHATEDREES